MPYINIFNTHTEYVVESIVGERDSIRGMEYHVKWKDYAKLSWEPEANLHCSDLLMEFKVGLLVIDWE